jgi:hypothetical protein
MTSLQDPVEPVLIVRLRGGLGNQLFEYAAGRALALRNQIPLWLDTTSGFRGDRYGRSYELGAFNITNHNLEELSNLPLGMKAEFMRRFVARRELLRMRLLARYFDPAIYNLQIKRPTILDAYCQSPRYFCDINELLRKELEFKTRPAGLRDSEVSDIMQANSVCLHARRLHGKEADGSRPLSVTDYYGACNMAYYQRAIREVATLHGDLRIFIFSDDIEWARQNAGAFAIPGSRVTVMDDEDPLRTYYLMTLCKHFIIANSTFSWWAAWLGRHPMKTVCVPAVWNRGERHFPRDLFPPAWKIVSTAVEGTHRLIGQTQATAISSAL